METRLKLCTAGQRVTTIIANIKSRLLYQLKSVDKERWQECQTLVWKGKLLLVYLKPLVRASPRSQYTLACYNNHLPTPEKPKGIYGVLELIFMDTLSHLEEMISKGFRLIIEAKITSHFSTQVYLYVK